MDVIELGEGLSNRQACPEGHYFSAGADVSLTHGGRVVPWQLSLTKAHVRALCFHERSTTLSDGVGRVSGEATGSSAPRVALWA